MKTETMVLLGVAALVGYEMLKGKAAAAPAAGMMYNPGAGAAAAVNSVYNAGYAAYQGGNYLYNLAGRIF